MESFLRRWPRPRDDRAGIPSGAGRVLVLCTGNVCRSPMAEGLLRARLADHDPEVRVESAGVAAPVGRHADPLAIELMAERGIDLGSHRARQVARPMLKTFPLALVMDSRQQEYALRRWRFVPTQVRRIGEWGDFDVLDPYMGHRGDFEEALALIERGLDDWVTRLWPGRAREARDGHA